MRTFGILVTGEPVESVQRERGSFAHLFRDVIRPIWPERIEEFDARRLEFPDPKQVDALVVTGSAASVTERSDWILATERALVGFVASGVPTLGVCFGHQLLGQALGGDVRRNPRGREIGTVETEVLGDDPLFAELPRRMLVNMSHVDSVVTLPPGAQVLCRTALEPNAALRFGERAWGVQFHPEFDASVMRGYLTARGGAAASEGIALDTLRAEGAPDAVRVLTRFAELARSGY
jgi:GMP synthase (glutamine-hydrolysing)